MYLSIIIPVYNSEKYIKRCIDSILSPTKFNYEIIIVDDGSTDATSELLASYSSLPNVKIFSQINAGVSSARNLGLKHAQGDYIMFVDSDDFLAKGWSDIVRSALVKYRNADLIVFSDKEGNDATFEITAEQVCGFSQCRVNASALWSKLYRRQIISKHNLKFNTNIINGEDLLFNLNYNSYCNKISCYDTGLYSYNINSSSATQTFSSKFIRSDNAFQQELIKALHIYGKEYLYLSDLSIINAWLVFFDRYSHNRYFNPKDIDLLVNNPIYQIKLKEYNKYERYFTKLQKITLHLLQKRQYKLAYLLSKFKHYLSTNKDRIERI